MRLKPWYVKLLLAWVFLALPGFVLGWAFAGHAPWNDLWIMFEPAIFDPVAVLVTLLGWAFLISPFILAPFGISGKPND